MRALAATVGRKGHQLRRPSKSVHAAPTVKHASRRARPKTGGNPYDEVANTSVPRESRIPIVWNSSPGWPPLGALSGKSWLEGGSGWSFALQAHACDQDIPRRKCVPSIRELFCTLGSCLACLAARGPGASANTWCSNVRVPSWSRTRSNEEEMQLKLFIQPLTQWILELVTSVCWEVVNWAA